MSLQGRVEQHAGQLEKENRTKEVLLDLIVQSAANVNTANAEHVRALAEAYALVVGHANT